MEKESYFKTSNSEWVHTSVLNLSPMSFSVTFSWNGEQTTVELYNVEDVLKLAKIFSDFLINNGIPNKIIEKK